MDKLIFRVSVQQFTQEWLTSFSIFGTMIDNLKIEKLTEPFSSGKFIFAQIWAKRDQNGSKIGAFGFLEKCFMLVFFLEIV